MRSFWKPAVSAALLLLCLVFILLSQSDARQSQAPAYALEFDRITISGTCGGSAHYQVEDALTHAGDEFQSQGSATYSMTDLLHTEGATGLDGENWQTFR